MRKITQKKLEFFPLMSSRIFLIFFLKVLIILVCNIGLHSGSCSMERPTIANKKPEQAYFSHRKVLLYGGCTNRDLSISQSRGSSSGIPEFIVQIVNTCVYGCSPSNIHLHCGWFASANMVNPRSFKRLAYDDCLVNGGRPMKGSQIIRFTYSNSFMYPMSFKSAKFC